MERMSPGWGTVVTDVYIETNGDDSRSGTSLDTALATIDEWFARFGDQILENDQAVHLGPGTFSPNCGLTNPPGPGLVKFYGTRTYDAVTGTVSAVQVWDKTAHTEGNYTVPGIDFSVYNAETGYALEITSGPRAGMSVVLAKNLGSNKVQSPGGEDMGGYAGAEPQVGDPVRIYHMTKILPGIASSFAVLVGDVSLYDLEIGVNEGPPNDAHRVYIQNTSKGGESHQCIFHGPDFMSGSWWFPYGCAMVHTHLYSEYFSGAANAFLWSTQVRGGAWVEFNEQTLFTDSGLWIGGRDGPGYVAIYGVTCMSDYTEPLRVWDGGSYLACHDQLIMKNGASQPLAFSIGAQCGLQYDAGLQPVITGTSPTAYAAVGGTTKASGAVPFFNTGNGAYFGTTANT